MNTPIDSISKPVILIAEDDRDQSDWLREALEHERYAVETVFSGDVALQRLTTSRYLVAIMDAHMPGLHGVTVLKKCTLKDSKSCTPIVMVSAFASPQDLDRYKKDGAVAAFAKPLNIVEVIRCVRQLTSKQPYTETVALVTPVTLMQKPSFFRLLRSSPYISPVPC